MKYVLSFCIPIVPTHPISPGNKCRDILGKDIYTYTSWSEQEVTLKNLMRAFLENKPGQFVRFQMFMSLL